ncbi:MAG: glycoside hydrolase [Gammaproteobacteria bacterium]|nr:glycoside hydrolase [Gammaproteobacteria bacterium]
MQYLARKLFPILAFLLTACTEQSLPVFDIPVPISVPAGAPAFGPRLATGPGGEVILSWMERGDDASALRYSRYDEGNWLPAVTVTTDEHMFVNWADLPAVTPLGDGSLLAHWLSYTADAPYAYQILTSYSGDNGATWSAPASPHSDGTPTEHGFVSAYRADGGIGLVWLDGRNTPDNAMTLRSATLTSDGVTGAKSVIDDRVCDCCQTDVAITAAGPVAVYRDRTDNEVRDIYVARQLDGQWQPGSPISDDGWVISGCPVNGPAIDAAGKFVAVAWFTAAEQKPKVQTAVSTNAGRTFSDAMEISAANTTGHVGVALIDAHSYVVSWMEAGKDGDYDIKLRAITANGQKGRAQIVGRTSVARNVPQLIRVRDKLLLAWTDTFDDASKVVSVEVAILGFYD